MAFGEEYLKLLGEINDLTREVTGVTIVDAYFGPENLSPEKTKRHSPPEKLLANLDALVAEAKETEDRLRRTAITSDIESIRVVVRWLSGEDIAYKRLVEGIFGITPLKFGQREISRAQHAVDDASAKLPGSDVANRILRWREKNKITGDALKKTIETDVAGRTKQIEKLFENRIFRHFPIKVENKGIIYKTVKGEPWSAYNYYQGNYTSINVFNIDRSFNKHSLIWTICHEYEHHVANLFKEKICRENNWLDLAAVLLHTKRSIIDEGTANCARDFLNLQSDQNYDELLEALRDLGSMVGLNVAYMQNVEECDDKTAAEYMASETFSPLEEARKQLAFSRPFTSDDKPNFWKPYIYTYFFGRRDYVLPTFQRAQKKDKLREFFQTLYLNPYSRSTSTWRSAFSRI